MTDMLEEDGPLFPVTEMEYGEGIIFTVSPDDESEETLEMCQRIEALLLEKIDQGPSSLTVGDLLETGEYDLIYADATSLLESEFGEDVVAGFGILSAIIVDRMIIVSCSYGDTDASIYEDEDDDYYDEDDEEDESDEDEDKWD